jgi:hypothetical protein
MRAARWQPEPAAGAKAGLDEVVRQRGVALFCLDRPEPAQAQAIAGLVAADVAAIYAGLDRKGVAPDGLCWLTECAGVEPGALAGLVAAGRPDGLVPVLATTVPVAAAGLAGRVGAVLLHRLGDGDLAAELAPLTGATVRPIARVLAPQAAEPGHGAARTEPAPAVPLGTMVVPQVPADELCALGDDGFVLVTGLAVTRTGGERPGGAVRVARCRAVTGRVPGWPVPPGGPPATRWPP